MAKIRSDKERQMLAKLPWEQRGHWTSHKLTCLVLSKDQLSNKSYSFSKWEFKNSFDLIVNDYDIK